MSILLSALEAFPKREILFVHAVLNEDVQPFRKTVDELARQHANLRAYYRYSEGGSLSDNASDGFLTAEYLEGLLSSRDADYYFCGPQPSSGHPRWWKVSSRLKPAYGLKAQERPGPRRHPARFARACVRNSRGAAKAIASTTSLLARETRDLSGAIVTSPRAAIAHPMPAMPVHKLTLPCRQDTFRPEIGA
jgi:hypothetical protein